MKQDPRCQAGCCTGAGNQWWHNILDFHRLVTCVAAASSSVQPGQQGKQREIRSCSKSTCKRWKTVATHLFCCKSAEGNMCQQGQPSASEVQHGSDSTSAGISLGLPSSPPKSPATLSSGQSPWLQLCSFRQGQLVANSCASNSKCGAMCHEVPPLLGVYLV